MLRTEPGVFGLVASDPTVSRTIDRLANEVTSVLAAIDTARARAWALAGDHVPDHKIDPGRPLIIDVDATLVTAHSEKEGAAPTFKKVVGVRRRPDRDRGATLGAATPEVMPPSTG